MWQPVDRQSERRRGKRVKVEIAAHDAGPQTGHDQVPVGGATVGPVFSVVTMAGVVTSRTAVAGSTNFGTALGAPLTS